MSNGVQWVRSWFSVARPEHLSPLTRANSVAASWQALESTKSKTFSYGTAQLQVELATRVHA